MPPAAFLHPKNAPKSLAAWDLPQTPLGELIALPRRHSWIKEAYLGEAKGEERGNGREGQERGGEGEGLWSLDPHNVGERLTPLLSHNRNGCIFHNRTRWWDPWPIPGGVNRSSHLMCITDRRKCDLDTLQMKDAQDGRRHMSVLILTYLSRHINIARVS